MLPNGSITKTLYHATTEENTNEILTNKKIRRIMQYDNPVYQGQRQTYIKKDPGSLGYGFYLFSSFDMAKYFLFEKLKDTDRILKIDIKLNREELLDLTDEQELIRYNKYKIRLEETPTYREWQKAFKNSSSGQSAFEGSMIDYYIVTLKKMAIKEKTELTEIKCVKAFTTTQIGISRGSFVSNSIEYCLKNNNVVTKIEEVLEVI